MGNGKKLSFWNDDWLGLGALKALFPDLFVLSSSPDATIKECWSSQGRNLSFRRLLNDREATSVTDSRRLCFSTPFQILCGPRTLLKFHLLREEAQANNYGDVTGKEKEN